MRLYKEISRNDDNRYGMHRRHNVKNLTFILRYLHILFCFVCFDYFKLYN